MIKYIVNTGLVWSLPLIISAQSIYMQSPRNGISVAGKAYASQDYFVGGPVVSYTIDGHSNISGSLLFLSDQSNSELNLDAKNLEVGYSYDFSSQFESEIYGLELALFFSTVWFDNVDARNESFGLSLNSSSRTELGSKSYIVPQLEVTYVPVSDTQIELEDLSYYLKEEYFSSALLFAFVFPLNQKSEFILEPAFSYSWTDNIVTYGANAYIIF